MMEIAKSETLKHFTILNKALLLLIKVNKTAWQSVPEIEQFLLIVTRSTARELHFGKDQ